MNNDPLIIGRQWLVNYHRQLLLSILCTGLLVSLAFHGLRLFDEFTTIPPERKTSDTSEHKQTLATSDFQLLFGKADDKPKALKAADIPATTLNLTLRGALAGVGDVPSSAIIQGNNGQDHLYRPGDTISGGATLESIHARYVVINYNGRLQKLLFPEATNQGAKPYTPQPASASTNNRLPPGPLHNANQVKDLEQKMEGLRRRIDNDDES
ncbi:type II secretion system protein N [Parendozoicomonas sp. Alg238-R29]|uniref:type II secretion system protein N n=1 Tax=Parendozoicomonas sp. Alg238-R29 TaxID=2993446 RepID=UPI00248E4E3A|nr:type II secretion system protein N [Parendozoicomonas sp. Alg238-R29]